MSNLSPAMTEALEFAADPAGLWRHPKGSGFYIPGRGTVPTTMSTIRALIRRGMVHVMPWVMDHDVVFAHDVVHAGTRGLRVIATGGAVRKPRDLEKYTDKATAVAFVEQLLKDVKGYDDKSLLKIHVQLRHWHPDWEKKS